MTPSTLERTLRAGPSRTRPRRRLATLALRLLAVLVAGVVLLELALRCLLFCGWLDGTRLAWSARQPGLYAHPQRSDLHWVLSSRWSGRGDESVPGYDPVLGWVGFGIRPPAYDHPDREKLRGRRPVLLFGDSYAQCNTPPEDCFQELLEEHPLGRTHRILNYGLGGYGLDQIYLLLRASLDAWADDDPLVLVSLMVDDDLDRAILSMRDWPKPRLRVDQGRLVLPTAPVPTVEARLAHTPFVPSYLALRLRHHRVSRLWGGYQHPDGSGVVDAIDLEKQALARALLEAIEAELAGRGIPHAYVLFHNEQAVEHPEITGWRDALVHEVLDGLGARVHVASDSLLERAEARQESIADYFGREGPLIGHYNPLGNVAALDCLARAISALEGLPVTPLPPLRAAWIHATRSGEGGIAVYGSREQPIFERPEEDQRLVLVPGREGSTEVEYALKGRVEGFSARVRHLPLAADAEGCGSARLTILADGEVLLARTWNRGDPPDRIEVPLSGKRTLILRVDDGGGDGLDCDRLVLGRPIFR